MRTIYVVEDDISIQEIECFALSGAGFQVEGFGLAREFYQALARRMPDLVLLDVMLPDEDGLSVVRKLRTGVDTAGIPILLVTAKTTELDKVKGLDIGADDYMTKPFGVLELISRVKALLRRSAGPASREKVLQLGDLVLDQGRRLASVADRQCELTYKEYELLKLLLVNAGIVLKRDLILERVWGTDFQGESRTLDMHIKTLRQKLGEAASMIRTVRNVGYVMEKE